METVAARSQATTTIAVSIVMMQTNRTSQTSAAVANTTAVVNEHKPQLKRPAMIPHMNHRGLKLSNIC